MPHWREFVDPSAPPGGYLPWKEVARRTSLSRTTAWRLQRRDEFPRAYAISPGRVGHLEREIEAWIASRSRPGERPARPPAAAPTEAIPQGRTAGRAAKASPPPIGDSSLRATPSELSRLAPPARSSRRTRKAEGATSRQITFNF